MSWCLGLGWPVRGALGPSGCFSQKLVFWPVPVLALLAGGLNRPGARVLPGRACYFPFSPTNAPACARARAFLKVPIPLEIPLRRHGCAAPPGTVVPPPPAWLCRPPARLCRPPARLCRPPAWLCLPHVMHQPLQRGSEKSTSPSKPVYRALGLRLVRGWGLACLACYYAATGLV